MNASKSNTWWFVWETEYPEEGSHLVSAPDEEWAKAIIRAQFAGEEPCSPNATTAENDDLGCLPADNLDDIEQWLFSADVNPASKTWPYVLAFAKRMEAKLERNRHKGDREGWSMEAAGQLLMRLDQETAELKRSMVFPVPFDSEAIADEAADVANFAMMIADVCGGVKP